MSQYRLPLWARAEWRGASTKLTSQIMFTELRATGKTMKAEIIVDSFVEFVLFTVLVSI